MYLFLEVIFFLNTSFNILESGLADMQINWRKPLFLGWRWFSRRYQIDRARWFTEKWAHCIHNATRATSWWRKGPVTQVQVPGMVLKLFRYNLIAWNFATISRYVYWSFVNTFSKCILWTGEDEYSMEIPPGIVI